MNIFDMLGMTETYTEDEKLFNQLKLQPFCFHDQNEHLVGRILSKDGDAEIYVTGMPAQFWRFIIHSNETGEITELSTGSGALVDYWPFVEKIMQGMIVVKII